MISKETFYCWTTYILKNKSHSIFAHNSRLKTQWWAIYFMTPVLTQQKESPKRFSILSFQSSLALKPETQLQKDPMKERAKPAKCKSSFCWDVFPLENPFFLLHTLILRLLGSLCEKLCAYKRLQRLKLKGSLGNWKYLADTQSV